MTNHTIFTDFNTSTGTGTTIKSIWLNDIDTSIFNVTTTASPLDISHHAAASKATPVDADEIAIGDSAQNFSFARLTFLNLRNQLFTLFGAQLNAATGKTTPVGADSFPIQDSAASNATKQVTFTNLKAYIASLLNMTGAVNEAQTTVASAATPDIWTGTGNIINYTGTVTATGFAAAPQAGARRMLDCAAAAVFTAGANMLIDGVVSGSNLTVAAGDRIEVYARTTTQFVLRHARVDGLLDAIPAASQQQSISASVASNALTVGLNQGGSLAFRNSTLSSGVPSQITIPSGLSLVVPSGATLGTVNGVLGRLILLAINNAGTVELAVVNQAGGVNLDETTLVSTTAISVAATANNVIYSTSARTNVAFRVVGYIEATEATAGTWATAPSLVQGIGGLATPPVARTWQAVTRTAGVTYYNTMNHEIILSIQGVVVGATLHITCSVNGVIEVIGTDAGVNSAVGVSFPVPPGASYSWSTSAGSLGAPTTTELR